MWDVTIIVIKPECVEQRPLIKRAMQTEAVTVVSVAWSLWCDTEVLVQQYLSIKLIIECQLVQINFKL